MDPAKMDQDPKVWQKYKKGTEMCCNRDKCAVHPCLDADLNLATVKNGSGKIDPDP